MILASAIKFFYKDDIEHQFPQIWSALRHADIYKRMFKSHTDYDEEFLEEGFITDSFKFLDRFDALYEAFNSHQIDSYNYGQCLYSEDVWPE